MSTRNPVGWFELYVRDMERAKVFYEKVLGVSLTQLKQSGGSLENMWAFPMNRDGSGASGAIAKMDGAPVGAGGTIIYFVCDDCAQAAKRAKEAGGHIVKDKFSIGDYGNIALVSDPDGNASDSIPWPNRPLPFVPALWAPALVEQKRRLELREKRSGKPIAAKARPKGVNVVDLMDA